MLRTSQQLIMRWEQIIYGSVEGGCHRREAVGIGASASRLEVGDVRAAHTGGNCDLGLRLTGLLAGISEVLGELISEGGTVHASWMAQAYVLVNR